MSPSQNKPDPKDQIAIPDLSELLKAFWPILVAIALIFFWIVHSSIADAQRAKRPEYQMRQAVLNHDREALRSALDNGAWVNYQFPWSNSTALHSAAWRGRPEIVRLLVERGADPNQRDSHAGETPLHTAVRGNHPGIVAMLLEAGADPGVRLSGDSEQCVTGIIYQAGSTPLDIARTAGFTEIAALLERRR